MEKIDTIELLLAEIGYQRKTENVGYHPTLSRSVSSFRHYLKPLDFFESKHRIEKEEAPIDQGTLTAKKVYTYDSFFTHSKQYGETLAKVEVPYRVKDGLAGLLREDISESEINREQKKSLFTGFFKHGKEKKFSIQASSGDLFLDEDDAIRILTLYVEKCRDLVKGDTAAMQRLGMLAEISGFRQMEDLAIIAQDTSDSDLKLFLSFLAKNADMDIAIRDYKQAYNVFTMVDKSQLID
jgi:hypothetical protein